MKQKHALRLCLVVMFAICLAPNSWAQRNTLRFTADDEIIIARNDLMQDLRRASPQDLRRILDALAFVNTKRNDDPEFHRRPARRLQQGSDAESPAFDPERNPDLEVYQRSSPEAAHDLFQLLKKIRSGSGGGK
jgi:hypothetical protein